MWQRFGNETCFAANRGGALARADSTAPVPAFLTHDPPCQIAETVLYKRYSVVLFRRTAWANHG
jgi:hypothetical protein